MKNKIKSLLAGAFLAFALLLLPQNVMANQTIAVSTVDDITDVMNVSSTSYAVGNGAYQNVVKFTLEKPAYVYVSGYSTVCYDGYFNLGILKSFAVYSDANCSNLVSGDSVEDITANKTF